MNDVFFYRRCSKQNAFQKTTKLLVLYQPYYSNILCIYYKAIFFYFMILVEGMFQVNLSVQVVPYEEKRRKYIKLFH